MACSQSPLTILAGTIFTYSLPRMIAIKISWIYSQRALHQARSPLSPSCLTSQTASPRCEFSATAASTCADGTTTQFLWHLYNRLWSQRGNTTREQLKNTRNNHSKYNTIRVRWFGLITALRFLLTFMVSVDVHRFSLIIIIYMCFARAPLISLSIFARLRQLICRLPRSSLNFFDLLLICVKLPWTSSMLTDFRWFICEALAMISKNPWCGFD